jgi:hypothetical protein
MNKVKRYIVASCGIQKGTKEPYCFAWGVEEWNGGSRVNSSDTMRLEEQYPLGTVLEFGMSLISE